MNISLPARALQSGVVRYIKRKKRLLQTFCPELLFLLNHIQAYKHKTETKTTVNEYISKAKPEFYILIQFFG